MLRVLCSFQTGFYINCMAEASPNLPSVGSLSLFLSPSSSYLYSLSLPLLLSVCFVFSPHFITNADQKTRPFSDCLHNKSLCWLEQRAPLRTRHQVFFCFFSEHLLPDIFRDAAVFSQRTCFSCH